jgi:hypothetical protein
MLQMQHFTSFFLRCKSNLRVQTAFLLNAAFAMAILDLISRVDIASFVNTLYSTNRITVKDSAFWLQSVRTYFVILPLQAHISLNTIK